jgi:uncharacterized protein YqjF (DUF2071 family)
MIKPVFLKAQWRKLIMANYHVDASVIEKYLPPNTQLDHYHGKYYVSLIGFMFMETAIKGIKIPFHINFEEVNLRFYVTYNDENEIKRGAVFISEIVSKPMISFVANTLFNEHYETLKTEHSWEIEKDHQKISYQWKKKKWYNLEVEASKTLQPMLEGSEEEFIAEHYWGYTKAGENNSLAYAVEHPRWEIYPVHHYSIDADFEDLYGKEFSFLNQSKPSSVFLVEGSDVLIRDGFKI